MTTASASKVKMDIVLEVFDTFIADRAFAAAFPASLPSSSLLQDGSHAANGTASTFGGSEGFVYRPATTYFSLEPSKWAYMTSIQRDNVYRQALNLYLITWYVLTVSPVTLVSDIRPFSNRSLSSLRV